MEGAPHPPQPEERRVFRVSRPTFTLAIATAALGCRTDRAPDAVASPRVAIVAPAEGDTVALPVTVKLQASGVEVIPASGLVEPGKGHHHLLIDVDVPDPALPLPTGNGVVHLGTGAEEYVIDSLPPGPHRIIAVFAAGNHVPMPEVRPDTVRFVVR